MHSFFAPLVAVSIALSSVAATEPTRAHGNARSEPVLLVALPVDATGSAESRWFAGLSEQLLHFRLSASDQLAVVPSAQVHAAVKKATGVSMHSYCAMAREVGATHVLQHSYEISRDRKSVGCLMELVPVSAPEEVVTFEQDISMPNLSGELDKAVMWVCKGVGVTMDNDLSRFFKIPAIPLPHRRLKDLGDVAARLTTTAEADMPTVAQRAMDIVNNDSRNLLAQYVAAQAFQRARRHYEAAMVLKDLLAVIPNHKALYLDICRDLRLSHRYKEVLKYAAVAESKAVKSSRLLLEGGLAFESLGRLHRARRIFEAVLDMEKDQPDALLFFTREHNRKGEYEQAKKLARRIISLNKRNGHAYFELGKALALSGKTSEAVAALEKSVESVPDEAAPRRLLGDLYSRDGRYGKAARHYAHTLRLNPKFYAGHVKTSETWQKARDLKRATAVLMCAERLFPDSVDLQRRIGLLQNVLGDATNATLHLERYVDKGQPNAEVYMVLGDIYTKAGKHDRALYVYNHALPLMKDTRACRFGLARVYMKARDYRAAISQLLDIVSEDSSYPKAYRLLADAWYAAGNTAEALSCYKRARRREGDDMLVQQRIADITFDSRNFAAAAAEYRKLTKLDPNNATAYFRLAVISLEQNSERQAEQFLQKARALGKADAETNFMLGCGYDRIGRPQKAIALYSACLKCAPGHEQALKNLVSAYLKAGQRTEAASSCVKLFELDNDRNRDYLAQAGLLYEAENSIARAHELYTMFAARGYRGPEIYLHLARLEHGHGSYEKVIELLSALDKKQLGGEETARMLGESYFKTKRHGEAIPWLETALVGEPGNAPVIEMLAKSYEAEGRLYKARSAYANLVDHLTDDKRAAGFAYHIGELYEKDKKLDEAIACYRQNARRHPDDVRNYHRLVFLLLQRDNQTEAREVLEAAATHCGGQPALLEKLAEVCAGQNDTRAAVAHYRKYVELKPDDFSAWRSIGDIEFSRGKYHEAAAALTRATAINARDFGALLMLARALREIDRIDEAVVAAWDAHTVQPNNPDVLTLLADCFRADRDTVGLIGVLQQSVQLRLADFTAIFELGNLLLSLGKTREGVQELEKACALRPDNTTVRLILARAYESLGNDGARLSHLQAALAGNAPDVEVHYELGRFYAQSRRLKKAQKCFAEALRIDGEHTSTLYAYSRLLHELGNTRRALHYMRRAVELNRFVSEYQVFLAQLAWEQNMSALALETVESALSIDPASVPAMSLGGVIYRQTGRAGEAKALLTRAISKDTSCAECYRNLGELCFDENDYARAIGYFKRAFDIAGYDERIAVRLARAYKLGCQDKKALALFTKVLAANPNQYEAFYELTNLYIRSGRIEDAKRMVAQRRKERKTVWHHLAAGEIYEIAGNADAAVISYAVALRLKPGIPEAYSGLGRVGLLKKDYSDAIVNIGKALAGDPYNPYLMLDLARAYEGIGENASAVEIYREVSAKYPQTVEAYSRFAQFQNRLREHMQAASTIEQGLKHNPRSARLLMELGHAYRMIGRYKNAVSAYNRAKRMGGRQYLDAYVYIANVYSKNLNNEKQARRYYKKYLRAGGEKEDMKRQIAVLEEYE